MPQTFIMFVENQMVFEMVFFVKQAMAFCLKRFYVLILFVVGTASVHAVNLDGQNVLRRGLKASPESLDPYQISSIYEKTILYDLYEGLISVDEMGTLIPGVAEKWTISDDKKTYVFYLKKTCKWSNGDSVTAHDFLYSLVTALKPSTAAPHAHILYPILNARSFHEGDEKAIIGVKALDDYTLEIQLEHPTPYFLDILQHHMALPVHRQSYEKPGSGADPQAWVTNGAYKIDEFVVNSHILLGKNPHYDKKTYFDYVAYFPVESRLEEFKKFQANQQLHVVDEIPSEQIDFVKQKYPDAYHTHGLYATSIIALNVTQDPFKGVPALRRALSLAIDRGALTQFILRAGEKPAYSFVPHTIPGYTPYQISAAGHPFEESLDEAKKLYLQSGFSDEKPLHIKLYSGSESNKKRVVVAIANMWKENLGVKVDIIQEDFKVFLSRRKSRDYQAYAYSWSGDYLDPLSFLDMFLSTAGTENTPGMQNTTYDNLIKKSLTEIHPERRHAFLNEAEKILIDDESVVIPLYHPVAKSLVWEGLEGYVSNMRNSHLSRFIRPKTKSDNGSSSVGAPQN